MSSLPEGASQQSDLSGHRKSNPIYQVIFIFVLLQSWCLVVLFVRSTRTFFICLFVVQNCCLVVFKYVGCEFWQRNPNLRLWTKWTHQSVTLDQVVGSTTTKLGQHHSIIHIPIAKTWLKPGKYSVSWCHAICPSIFDRRKKSFFRSIIVFTSKTCEPNNWFENNHWTWGLSSLFISPLWEIGPNFKLL